MFDSDDAALDLLPGEHFECGDRVRVTAAYSTIAAGASGVVDCGPVLPTGRRALVVAGGSVAWIFERDLRLLARGLWSRRQHARRWRAAGGRAVYRVSAWQALTAHVGRQELQARDVAWDAAAGCRHTDTRLQDGRRILCWEFEEYTPALAAASALSLVVQSGGVTREYVWSEGPWPAGHQSL